MKSLKRSPRKSARIELDDLDEAGQLVIEKISRSQEKATGWIRVFGAVLGVSGCVLFFLTQDADTGSFQFGLPNGLTFKGGFAGLLVAAGTFLVTHTPRLVIVVRRSDRPT